MLTGTWNLSFNVTSLPLKLSLFKNTVWDIVPSRKVNVACPEAHSGGRAELLRAEWHFQLVLLQHHLLNSSKEVLNV